MKIDLSNPPYAVKLNDLGFAYSHTDHKKGVIVYTRADPRLAGSKWVDHWDDMECITDKGKTVTYHAHHMRDVIEPVKKSGMFGEQFDVKKKLHTITFYTED